MWGENGIVNIYFEGAQLRWESRGGTFTHAVRKRSDNRSKSVLHDEPVSCNSSQLLHIGILLMKNKHVLYLEKPAVSEFLSHPGDTTIDTQATTTGLTVEEHCVHHKWGEEKNTNKTTATTPVSRYRELTNHLFCGMFTWNILCIYVVYHREETQKRSAFSPFYLFSLQLAKHTARWHQIVSNFLLP